MKPQQPQYARYSAGPFTFYEKTDGTLCSGETTIIPSGTPLVVITHGQADRHLYRADYNGKAYFGWMWDSFTTTQPTV